MFHVMSDSPRTKPDRSMPVPLGVGVAMVLVGTLAGPGPLRIVGFIGGVLAIAYGVGQYLRQTRGPKP
jgi:hypothetical protein